MSDRQQKNPLEEGIERLILDYEAREGKLVIGVSVTRKSEQSLTVNTLVIPRALSERRAG